MVEATRRGRNAADDEIVDLVDRLLSEGPTEDVRVVTSDTGLRDRLPATVTVEGVSAFRTRVDY